MITNILPYQLSFRAALKPYEKNGYIQSQKCSTEADIIEAVLKKNPEITDVSNIYTSVGKIFENADLLPQAKMCFEKNALFLQNNRAPLEKINGNENDLQRIHNKMQKLLDVIG